MELGFLFVSDDLDLGKSSVVKHTIELTDPTPFKKWFRQIQSHQFIETKKHLQTRLKIGAIRKSSRP